MTPRKVVFFPWWKSAVGCLFSDAEKTSFRKSFAPEYPGNILDFQAPSSQTNTVPSDRRRRS